MNTSKTPTERAMTFVDTSAFFAVLDRDDRFHAAASKIWTRLVDSGGPLIAHNYVLVETFALIQRRLGSAALRAFNDDVMPSLRLLWVDERLHSAGTTACLAAARRDMSLVDWVSFELMRTHGLEEVFAFDQHFREQGFTVIP